MSAPVYVFLGGKKPDDYFKLTIDAIKYLKKSVKELKNENIAIIMPFEKDLEKDFEAALSQGNDAFDAKNILYIKGQKHFENWNNSQRLLDVKQLDPKKYDPIVFLDSDTFVMRNIFEYVDKFKKSGKKVALLKDFINDFPHFTENWGAWIDKQKHTIPQTTFILFKSAEVPSLVEKWKKNWEEWIFPAPFLKKKDPARYYKYSRLNIGQYSLGQTLRQWAKNFDQEVDIINRTDVKVARNLGIKPQAAKRKFLGGGSTFSNEKDMKIKLNVKKGQIYDPDSKGDPFVVVKIQRDEDEMKRDGPKAGDLDRKTRVIKNTLDPEWNEEFEYDDVNYGDAENVVLTLKDDAAGSEIGKADLPLIRDKTNEQGPLKSYTIPVKDADGNEKGLLEVEAEFYVGLEPDEDEDPEDAARAREYKIPVEGKEVETAKGRTAEQEAAAAKSRDLPGGSPARSQAGKTGTPASSRGLDASSGPSGGLKVALVVKNGKINKSHDPLSKDDGFVKVSIGPDEKRTKAAPNTQTPTWNETLTFDNAKPEDVAKVKVTIWDEDSLTKHDLIGTADPLSLVKYKGGKPARIPITLYSTKNGKKVEEAKINVEVTVVDAPSKPSPAGAKTRSLGGKGGASTGEPPEEGEQADEEAVDEEGEPTQDRGVKESKGSPKTARQKSQTRSSPTRKSPTKSKPVPGALKVGLVVKNGKINKSHDPLTKDDGYVVVSIGPDKKRTKSAPNTQTPTWNETLTFYNANPEDVAKVTVTIFDEDLMTKDDLIGTADPLNLVKYKGGKPARIPITLYSKDAKGKKVEEAKINVEVTVIDQPADEGQDEEQAQDEDQDRDEPATGETPDQGVTPQGDEGGLNVSLNVKNGKILKKHDPVNKDDGYVKVTIGPDEKRTKTAKNTQDPVWNETLSFENARPEDVEKVTVTIWDEDSGTENDLIGTANVLSLLPYKGGKVARIPITLYSTKDGKKVDEAKINIEVTVVDPSATSGKPQSRSAKASPTTKDRDGKVPPPAPTGRNVSLKIKDGSVYHSHDLTNKDDPFVKVKVGAVEKRTTTMQNTQDPVWNENLNFDNVSDKDAGNVEVTIWDEDSVTKNDLIGTAKLNLLKYPEGKNQRITIKLFNPKKVEEATINLDVLVSAKGAAPPESESPSNVTPPLGTSRDVAQIPGYRGPSRDPNDRIAPSSPDRASYRESIRASLRQTTRGGITGVKSLGVNVESAKFHTPSTSYCKVVVGHFFKQTQPVEDTEEPVWNEQFIFTDVTDEALGRVEVTLWDSDSTEKIGTGVISLQLLRDVKKDFIVSIVDRAGKEQGTLKISAWRIDIGANSQSSSPAFIPLSPAGGRQRGHGAGTFATSSGTPAPGAVVAPKSNLKPSTATFVIKSGKVSKSGKGDLYVVLKIDGVEKKRTNVKKNTQTPLWNEPIRIDDLTLAQQLIVSIELWDKDKIIGSADYPINESLKGKKRPERAFQLKEKGVVEATLDFEVEIADSK